MSRENIQIIQTVTTPLAFFVLIVLLVEGIFGIAAYNFEVQRTEIVHAMEVLIFLLVLIVTSFALFRPSALKGAEEPEITKIKEDFKEKQHVADMVQGEWTFVSRYQPEGKQQTVEVSGPCEITKGKYGIYMKGNCVDQGGHGICFIVNKVFINEDMLGLTYIFKVTRGLGQDTLGLGQVTFLPDKKESKISQMEGDWSVLGNVLSGKAVFNRKK